MIQEVSHIDFTEPLFQYLKTKKNKNYEIVMWLCLIHFSFTVSCTWKFPTINELTSRKTSQQGGIKTSCKKEKLQKWHHHFNNLLSRAAVLEDEYRDNEKFVPEFCS